MPLARRLPARTLRACTLLVFPGRGLAMSGIEDRSGRRTPAVSRITLPVLFASVVVVTIDISMTSTALPAIADGLGVAPATTIWIVNIYYLAVVAALLPTAAMGEIFGHERVFTAGLAIFAAGALIAGLADSLEMLIFGRAVLGIGSAATSATTPALIRALYPPERMGRGLGLYATIVGVSITAGPTATSAIGPCTGPTSTGVPTSPTSRRRSVDTSPGRSWCTPRAPRRSRRAWCTPSATSSPTCSTC